MYDILKLQMQVGQTLSDKRFLHSLSVKKTAEELALLCCPQHKDELAVAALLHDIAKEYSTEALISIIDEPLSDEMLASPQVLHSIAAPYVIREKFPEYATKNVINATGSHTLGSPDMSVFDEIIFLSDYIEETRQYETSKLLRHEVFSKMKNGEFEKNLKILHIACVKSIDYTVNELKKRQRPVISKMLLTKNALMSKI